MPVIKDSTYRAPFLFGGSHLQTILPTLFRKVDGVVYRRERIDTPDGDFVDLDFSSVGSPRAVLVSHGLEGKSDRAYMKGMVRAFNRRGWDGVAFNFRGCSGEPNRTATTYHSGKTEDLHAVVEYLLSKKGYTDISLVGFSLGGNLTLKYAGEMGTAISPRIRSAIGISAPCDLVSSSIELHKPKNFLYTKRFLSTLIEKMKVMSPHFPPGISRDYRSIKTLKDFDDMFTAPLNGFRDAMDYWKNCSSRKYISGTAIPTLILNARDDPILGPECFPYAEAEANSRLFLEVPGKGGHVGFITFGHDGEFWDETRAAEFAENALYGVKER
ncbi:MAG TPA: alpha/beta fold hydrolase [Spirochaetota bacterium]|nr:alpha/beta fold hydrolase [Spirochaetota bacterium]